SGYLYIESDVIKEVLRHPRPIYFSLGHFAGHRIRGALAPGMSTQRLRPQAEGTLCRASTRRIQRYKGMQKKWNVVAAHIQVAVVNFGHVRQSIEVLRIGT